ncbi:MAG: sensor histidine kinase [Dethiobacter sp.]|jgi:two-component system sensor histidine kinase LytS|nr:sensor histidine kinase [Dethiobacter sp.]
MFELLVVLLQRIGITVTVAFVLTRVPLVRRLIDREQTEFKERVFLVVIFGLFGILGTYTGIPVQSAQELAPIYGGPVTQQQALANSRVVGIFVAGLLGGPYIGLGAGLLAGIHRYSLGGFTGFSCGLATAVEGLLAGIIGRKLNRVHIRPAVAFTAGALLEALQMVIILLLARPFADAVALVKLIALPMILSNAAGITIFVLILQSVLAEEQRAGAVLANKSLQIADQTLPYLRAGLNAETAKATAEIIKRTIQVAAVVITDKEQILAHVGIGDEDHRPGTIISSGNTRRVLETGSLHIARTKGEIACVNPHCQFTSSIIVPLKREETILGALHLFWRRHQINAVDLELAHGLAHLFSTQLELARLDEQARLLAKAEIKALQAQINPHFLFNCLNTIVSMYREKPETARCLLINLGNFFRQNLQSSNQELVTLEKEIGHIQSYLVIEKARFQEDLQVNFEVDPDVLDILLPPLTLQPLVENAIKHGLRQRLGGGAITIKAGRVVGGAQITVADDGVGMTADKIHSCLNGSSTGTSGSGIGLSNVHQRLMGMFGRDSGLKIVSRFGRGTDVTLFIPGPDAKRREVSML